MHKIESIAKIPKISINYKPAKVPKISLEITKSTFTHAIGKKEKKNSIWFKITQNLYESKITPEQKDSLITKLKPLTYIWELFKFWKLKLSLSLILKQINTLKSNTAKWDFEVFCIDIQQILGTYLDSRWCEGLPPSTKLLPKTTCVVVSIFQSTIGIK